MYLEKMRLKTNTPILELSENTGISMIRLSKVLTMQDVGTCEELGKILFFLRIKSTNCGFNQNEIVMPKVKNKCPFCGRLVERMRETSNGFCECSAKYYPEENVWYSRELKEEREGDENNAV
jgi:hypothetical protein